MPRGDGTGPSGAGPGTGRGRGQPGGAPGRGRMGGNKAGAGPPGYCICPACGNKVEHKRAVPCYDITCPNCGERMRRE